MPLLEETFTAFSSCSISALGFVLLTGAGHRDLRIHQAFILGLKLPLRKLDSFFLPDKLKRKALTHPF